MTTCACGCGRPVAKRFSQGERHPHWRGDEASRRSLHYWLNRHYPRQGVCSWCGQVAKTEYSFKYHPQPHVRDPAAYDELCVPCHKTRDWGQRRRILREAGWSQVGSVEGGAEYWAHPDHPQRLSLKQAWRRHQDSAHDTPASPVAGRAGEASGAGARP